MDEYRFWTSVELARKVGIATGTILHTLKKKLKMWKICARWVPHNLKKETWQRMETARFRLEHNEREGERFLRPIITLDKNEITP